MSKAEVEYGGIKIRGGKLLLILPLLGTLGGVIWAGFEGYARWTAMEEKINEYVAPDLSGFQERVAVTDERINSVEENVNTKINALSTEIHTTLEAITIEVNALKELVTAAQDDARTIRNDLRSDIHTVLDQVAAVDKRSRTTEQEIRSSIRTSENNIRKIIQHAEDRFDGKRTAIESDAQRRAEALDVKLKELEDRLRDMLEKALNNPLAGK
tara:strand:- start:962 stop:1600 length:639 start_codon:yes stop_codon:yes gene_type:complete